MKQIIVPIKQVPETSNVKMDPETGTMIRKGLESIINPLDLYALESALLLKDNLGIKVNVLSMGPKTAEEALREALALGCDDAILLSDRSFGGSDTWSTSYTLSQAIQKLGNFDLIICGERATDGETGQVGPGIAAFLKLPLITFVRKILVIENETLKVERLVEDGIEKIRSNLPAVITVVKEIANPRLPTLKGMRRAKAQEILVWGPDHIDANLDWIGLKGSPTRVVKIDKPKVFRDGKILLAKTPEQIGEAAEEIIGYLRKNHFID